MGMNFELVEAKVRMEIDLLPVWSECKIGRRVILLTSRPSCIHTGWYVFGAEEVATQGGKAA